MDSRAVSRVIGNVNSLKWAHINDSCRGGQHCQEREREKVGTHALQSKLDRSQRRTQTLASRALTGYPPRTAASSWEGFSRLLPELRSGAEGVLPVWSRAVCTPKI